MRYLFLLLFAIGFSFSGTSQNTTNPITAENLKELKTYEDSLHILSYHVLRDEKSEERYYACQSLIKTFVKALKVKDSFQYPFDSIRHVSIMYPADSSFRIITWQLYVNANDYKYYGAIQMNTSDLKLFPLSDRSSDMEAAELKVVNNREWYGALYYNIKQVNTPNGAYYTLFGFDNLGVLTRRKIIDVLSFNEKGKPQFGAPIFIKKDGQTMKETAKNRVIMEYSAEGSITCNYSDEYGLIIFDNLIRISGGLKGQGMMNVSDGSYHGYKFNGVKWVYVDKVFHDFQESAPREKPVLDNRKDGLFGPGRKKNKK
jgi:hypothetical protein